jgi:hypothetical protein
MTVMMVVIIVMSESVKCDNKHVQLPVIQHVFFTLTTSKLLIDWMAWQVPEIQNIEIKYLQTLQVNKKSVQMYSCDLEMLAK